jgi:hypothetical protein
MNDFILQAPIDLNITSEHKSADNFTRVVHPRPTRKKKQSYKLELFKRMMLANPTVSPKEIAYTVYRCKNRRVAGVIASHNMKQLGITLQDLLARRGLTDEKDVDDLSRLRRAKKVVLVGDALKKVDDTYLQFKALELTRRLKGDFTNNTAVDARSVHITVTKEDEQALATIAHTLNEMNRQLHFMAQDGEVQAVDAHGDDADGASATQSISGDGVGGVDGEGHSQI